MNYGLGSDDPEELAYYCKIWKEMDNIKKEPVKRGMPFTHDDYFYVLTSQTSVPTNKYVRFEVLPYTDKGSTI